MLTRDEWFQKVQEGDVSAVQRGIAAIQGKKRCLVKHIDEQDEKGLSAFAIAVERAVFADHTDKTNCYRLILFYLIQAGADNQIYYPFCGSDALKKADEFVLSYGDLALMRFLRDPTDQPDIKYSPKISEAKGNIVHEGQLLVQGYLTSQYPFERDDTSMKLAYEHTMAMKLAQQIIWQSGLPVDQQAVSLQHSYVRELMKLSDALKENLSANKIHASEGLVKRVIFLIDRLPAEVKEYQRVIRLPSLSRPTVIDPTVVEACGHGANHPVGIGYVQPSNNGLSLCEQSELSYLNKSDRGAALSFRHPPQSQLGASSAFFTSSGNLLAPVKAVEETKKGIDYSPS